MVLSPNQPATALDLSGGFVTDPLSHWAQATPDKTAIVARGFEMSYRDLEDRTNQIAHTLRQYGVTRGDRVAFVLERGPHAVLLEVAILKAGAAYVPLDAASPVTRILDCIEDARPRIVVYAEDHAPFEPTDTFTGIPLDQLLDTAEKQSPGAIPHGEIGLSPSDLAYIIFTSGTTGRPKGVAVTHASLTNFIDGNQQVCIRVQPDDRVFQGFSPASDGHHEEVWPTFQAGATLVVATNKEIYSGIDLAGFLNQERVTIVSCAPTLLSMVEEDVPTLRRILFGAENCPASLVQRWWNEDREILNTYGPTEATVGATFSICRPDETITIGKPLPNYECYVMDEALNQVPDGETGELCIAGIGVAKGYFGRDDLTAAKFVPNPYAKPGFNNATLYRTGDRSMVNVNGNIVWLGRIDSQVKIRGHRIELSEIENQLSACPSVQTGVVVARETDNGEAFLAALIVVRPGVDLDIAEVLGALRDTLPGYMVPQVLEEVPAIPRLPSGKVDRAACQRLHGQAFRLEREIVPPRTEQEQIIVAALQELFPHHEISATDDFFRDLGGYSLLASQFISKLRNDPRYTRLSVLDLYENPTVRGLAYILESQTQTSQEFHAFKPVPPQRYNRARVWQGIGVLALFGVQGLFWLGPIFAAIYLSTDAGHHNLIALFLGVAIHAVSVPLYLLLVIVAKWVVVGRFKPGDYPMWGNTYLRWWFVQRMMANAPITLITGTPLAAVYLRLLGAKVGRNVMIESLEIDCPDLIEIGDNCSLENSAWIHASDVSHGELHLRPIRMGDGCSMGVRAGLSGGAVMEEGSSLRDVTHISAGTTVPKGEEWAGSIARKADHRILPEYDPAQQPSRSRIALFGAVQLLLITVLAMLDSLPFVTVAFTLYNRSDGFFAYLMEPVYAVALVAFAAIQVLAVKWISIGKLQPGTYDFPGWYWLRHWFAEKHLELVIGYIVPVYDSLFARPWCIAMGMKCGPRCEIALPRRMPYDLVEMGGESFLASEVSIGRPIRRNGKIMLERTSVGTRAFLGNDSVVPQGSNVPDEFLLGVLSVYPANEEVVGQTDQAWLGSPPFRLPVRQVSGQFDAKHTYQPTLKLYAQRLIHEAARVILPGICSLIIASVLVESFVIVWNETTFRWALCSVPLLYLGGVIIGALMCRLSKRLFIGKYHPTIEPLWSPFVWRTETHSAILHDFAAPMFLTDLVGTPFMSSFLRMMGATVGKRAFINTTDWTETDLIHLGEDVAINANAPLQAHLFEDRVMKVGPIKVGDRSSVGNYSVVLCDSEVKNDATVSHLSLVMKGETIPSHTYWAGSPAQAGVEYSGNVVKA